MKEIFKIGDRKTYKVAVQETDVAQFEGVTVHRVCATFALASFIEWSSRLFVLEMKEEDEEGIGTFLTINHKSPALVGDQLKIVATVKSIEKNELICTYLAMVDQRIIAEGETGQKILKKVRIDRLFKELERNDKAEE